jgi:periplasmic protein TonB
MVAHLNISYLRFFAASVVLHFVVFFIANSAPPPRVSEPETISVSVLDVPEKERPAPTPVPKIPRTRPENRPAIVAEKDSPRLPARTDRKKSENDENEMIARVEPLAAPPAQPGPAPSTREIIPEQSVIVERPLPTLKELLPPASWSPNARNSGSVSLNTRDPIYVTYFTKIKQMILSRWEYPELALRYGLEGKLSVEFTISANGQLERLRVVRSSGSHILDEEALRAIQAAAPFPPIPRWIQPNPLRIFGDMIYDDNRLNYQPGRG